VEERILGRMPEIFLAGVVPAAACAALAEAPLVTILALAFSVAWALSLVPLALACLALGVAKRVKAG
jgi:hypothetical protein